MEDRPLGSATKWAFQIFSNSVRFSGIGLARRRHSAHGRGRAKKSANLSFAQGAGWSKSQGATSKRRCASLPHVFVKCFRLKSEGNRSPEVSDNSGFSESEALPCRPSL